MAITNPEIKMSAEAKHLAKHIIWKCEEIQRLNYIRFYGNNYIPYWMEESVEELKQYLLTLE